MWVRKEVSSYRMREKNISQPAVPFPYLFFYFVYTCACTRPFQTTVVIFIRIRTININETILSCLLRVKHFHGNKLSPPLNHLMIFTWNHIIYGKAINNIHYIYFFYCHVFPNIRHRIIIIPLVVPNICCGYHLNNWQNLLDSVNKNTNGVEDED